MNMDEIFDEWFDTTFPKENFGHMSGIFREALKTDIAKKAFIEGLRYGFDSNCDSALRTKISEYLENV
jgi:hypothetical protein